MNIIAYLTIFISLLGLRAKPTIYSPHDAAGGFQLIMTLEQKKKTIRIMDDLDNDVENLYTRLDRVLFKNKEKRKDIILDNRLKEQIIQLSHTIVTDINGLNDCFRSIYFSDYIDSSYREDFEPIQMYQKTLETPSNYINVEYLYELHSTTQSVKYDLTKIRSLIKRASIKSQEDINKRYKNMSMWEWLVGR